MFKYIKNYFKNDPHAVRFNFKEDWDLWLVLLIVGFGSMGLAIYILALMVSPV